MTVERTVAIPKGVSVEIAGNMLKIKGPKGQLERNVRFPAITVRVEGDEVVITTESDRKRTVAMVGTIAAHAKNMCTGVTEGFEYRMKVVYSHFPIQLKLQGNRLEIVNFLGEKKARYAQIQEGVKANIGNDEVVLTGIDKEKVGISSANIEHATKIRYRDPRIFQDGIYIVTKG
ncbi:large subunit ribosomal protein L6 [Methanolinea mesophila]|uniref:50S ribosomal protein L6 n=1 Tax=Methanolinea mesophila TaxID=547055 RepID=UPI001AEA1169|nr:50S ribosomal protein L6 [Methanolinea mesophila]MBP1928523.1 large subunit ribosomal protein L6 [Methanolinea mesophila]